MSLNHTHGGVLLEGTRSSSLLSGSPQQEEVSRLRELLGQALKREAEAHRKMRHLYEKLQNSVPPTMAHSMSNGERAAAVSVAWCAEVPT